MYFTEKMSQKHEHLPEIYFYMLHYIVIIIFKNQEENNYEISCTRELDNDGKSRH